MAQMVNASRRPDFGAGVAPLKGTGDPLALPLPVLDSVLPIADSALADYEALRYAHRRSEASETIDIDLERAEELLTRSASPPQGTNHLAAVRARLATVVQGLATSAPMHDEPPGPVSAEASLVDVAAPAPPPAPAAPSDSIDRASRRLAHRIVELTLRAEAAETRLAALQAQWEAEMATQSTLGRRFGREPRESFAAFVARLGMIAKAAPLNRARSTRPGGIDTV